MKKDLEFSILVAVIHGGDFLRDFLSSLHKLDFPEDSYEVLVAGRHDDEEARRIVETQSAFVGNRIRYIGCVNSRHSALVNSACEAAGGSFFFVTEDDCILLPDCLGKLRDVFSTQSDAGVIGGKDELMLTDSASELALDCVLNSFMGTGGLRKKSGFRVGKYYPKLWNMAIPRSVYLQVAIKADDGTPQLLNQVLGIHEEMELVDRIEKTGKKAVFAPEIVVKHHRHTTLYDFAVRNYRGANACRRLGAYRFPHLILSAFVLLAGGLPVLSIFYRPFIGVFLICICAYSMALLLVTVKGLMKTKRLSSVAYIPSFLVCLHFLRGIGYLFPKAANSKVH